MMQMINNLGDRMVGVMKMMNIFGLQGNRFAYELGGMEMAIRAMGMTFELHYNEDVTKFTGLTLMGQKFEL